MPNLFVLFFGGVVCLCGFFVVFLLSWRCVCVCVCGGGGWWVVFMFVYECVLFVEYYLFIYFTISQNMFRSSY